MPGYVLDTSALLAAVQNEPGGVQVLEVLGSRLGGEVHEPSPVESEPPPVYLPFMALMELEYNVSQQRGLYEAARESAVIRAWPVELVESSPRWRLEAARLKAEHSISLGDAWVAGLAILRSARLVHRDPEYDDIPELESVRLPNR